MTSQKSPATQNRHTLTEAVLVAILPVLLLFDLHAQFYWDWPNHIWLADYCGAYFAHHSTFPLALNTFEHSGVLFPVYYGYGFYPLLGLFSTLLKASFTFRVVAYLLFAIQHFLLLRLLLGRGVKRMTASVISMTVTLAVYPLTNLYNRSALTEFFATLCLSIAVLALFYILTETRRLRLAFYTLFFSAMLVMAAVSHPITMVYGALFLGLLFLVITILSNDRKALFRKVAWVMPVVFLSSGLILAPWLWATIKTMPYLNMVIVNGRSGVMLWPDTVDHLFARISPVLFDKRTWGVPLASVKTPYLDAPTNVFLLALVVSLFFSFQRSRLIRNRHSLNILFWGAIGFWMFLVFASVTPDFWDFVPSVLKNIQFGYRLVTYQNLALLTAALLMLSIERKKSGNPIQLPLSLLIPVVCFTLSCFGQKMFHASAIATRNEESPIFRTAEEEAQLLHIPSFFNGIGGYVTPRSLPCVESIATQMGLQRNALVFRPGVADKFGSIGTLEFKVKSPGWFGTNLQSHYWNKILLDGKPLPEGRIGTYFVDNKPDYVASLSIAVGAESGSHTLSFATEFPREYRTLITVSAACSLLLCGSLLLSGGWLTFVALRSRIGQGSPAGLDQPNKADEKSGTQTKH